MYKQGLNIPMRSYFLRETRELHAVRYETTQNKLTEASHSYTYKYITFRKCDATDDG